MCKKTFLLLLFLLTNYTYCQDKIEVYFDFGKYDVTVISQKKIDSIITASKPINILSVNGFADNVDSDNSNILLAQKRATAITDYLKSKNVSFSDKFAVWARGENFKQAANNALNRKVVITYNRLGTLDNFKKGDVFKLNNINFVNGCATILATSLPYLNELLAMLEKNKRLKIEIQGHICCIIDKKFIDSVSTARAKKVYDFLIKKKISSTRLQYKGYGTSRPLYPLPEKSEQERAANRRVEILILDN